MNQIFSFLSWLWSSSSSSWWWWPFFSFTNYLTFFLFCFWLWYFVSFVFCSPDFRVRLADFYHNKFCFEKIHTFALNTQWPNLLDLDYLRCCCCWHSFDKIVINENEFELMNCSSRRKNGQISFGKKWWMANGFYVWFLLFRFWFTIINFQRFQNKQTIIFDDTIDHHLQHHYFQDYLTKEKSQNKKKSPLCCQVQVIQSNPIHSSIVCTLRQWINQYQRF